MTTAKEELTKIKTDIDKSIQALLNVSQTLEVERLLGLYRAMQELCNSASCIARELKWMKEEEEWEEENDSEI